MRRLRVVLGRIGIGCVLAMWFSSSPVAADPISFSSFRYVEGRVAASVVESGDFEGQASDGTELPGPVSLSVSAATPPPGWNLPTIASSIATQFTDVSATHWTGSGTAETQVIMTDGMWGGATAESIMSIAFTLVEPMSYQFSGTLTGQGGLSAISLDTPTGLGWAFQNGNAVPLVAARRGLLPPGDYVFGARVFSEANSFVRRTGTSAFEVQFTLTDPVPEPATLVLFATGAACVGRAAWRRRREDNDRQRPI